MFKSLFKKRKTSVLISDKEIFEFVSDSVNILLSTGDEKLILTEESALSDIGFNSMKFINFMYLVEEKFDTDFEKIVENVDLGSIKTIGDLIKIIKKIR